jgi:hypothetical protein
VNSAEEDRANFCKGLNRKLLFSALYSMYMVTLNEARAILKVSAQAKIGSRSTITISKTDMKCFIKNCKNCSWGWGGIKMKLLIYHVHIYISPFFKTLLCDSMLCKGKCRC